MATGDNKVKRKRSLEVRETNEWKKVKFILKTSSSQSFVSNDQSSDTTTSAGVMRKCNSNDVEKEKDDSLESKKISAANQIDDKASPNKLMGREKEVIQNCTVLASQTETNCRVSDQGGCLESTSTSEQSKSLCCITQEEDDDSLKDEDSLKDKAAKLKRKIKKMNRELRKYATKCMELNDENILILEELKQVCHPFAIQMLEAKNPYNNPPTNQETELCQR